MRSSFPRESIGCHYNGLVNYVCKNVLFLAAVPAAVEVSLESDTRTTWAVPLENYDLKHYNIKVQINNTVVLAINTTDTFVDYTPSVSGGVSVVLPSGETRVVRPYDKVNVTIAAVTMCGQVGVPREINVNDFNNSGE